MGHLQIVWLKGQHTRELMKSMGLATVAELLDARLEDAFHWELTYLDFLGELLDTEHQERKLHAG